MDKTLTRKRSANAFALSAVAAAVAGGFAAQTAWADDAPAAPAAPAAEVSPAPPAAAGDDTDTIETIFVTGSAIRRIKNEKSLPVQIIDSTAIAKTGASSVTDLIQKMPAIQGSQTEQGGVGGTSFGFAGVSLRDLGENRTLVLLNGHRLARFGGQSLTGYAAGIDLNSIPISSIERVEILTDGASALYGSDAVAGVVNFITKKKTTEGDVSVSYYAPKGGAKEPGFSISKGFGDYEKDGYNLFLTWARDRRSPLKSTDRKFSSSGIIDFNYRGQRYRFFNGSPRNIPANVLATDSGDPNNPNSDYDGQLVSPYLLTNGSCPANSAQIDSACYYDYTKKVEIFPERRRTTLSSGLNVEVSPMQNFFLDVLYSDNREIARTAAVPGEVTITKGSALFNQYLAPLQDSQNRPIFTDDAIASYRVADLGQRTDDGRAYYYNVATGLEGIIQGWDYNFALTQSESFAKDFISGYPGALAFSNLMASGLINPFVGPGQQSQAGQAALASASYHGYWDGGVSRLQTAELRGSRELFEIAEGKVVSGAVGVSYNREKFQSRPSQFAQANLDDPVAGTPAAGGPGTGDQRFGDAAAAIPYGAKREVVGAFLEVVAPVLDTLELTGSTRYDKYSDVGDTTNFKGSFRFTPIREFLVRGSYGTGFNAPTVPQLKASRQAYGVTYDPYDCTPELAAIAAGLNAQCRPNNTQYDVVAGGNPNLKPEKSQQLSVGFVIEPSEHFSAGADFWRIWIRDVFGQIDQGEAFSHPNAYAPNAWTTALDIGTNTTYLAYNQTNLNTGKQIVSGIDYNIQGNIPTALGKLGAQLVATELLIDKQQTLKNGPYYGNIGDYSSSLSAVAFRWQGRFITSLEQNAWSHSVTVNYASGYKDVETEVDAIDSSGNFIGGPSTSVRLHAKAYVTTDLQSTWNVVKPVFLTVGVLNVFDQDPPLTLTTYNFQIGYDARYADPRGRTLYGRLSYRF